jgi:hypothetical protein
MLFLVTNAGNCWTCPSLCPAGHQTNLHEHHSSVRLTQACDSREF